VIGSGYRTAYGFGSLYLKPYSTTTCNMTVTHNESTVGCRNSLSQRWDQSFSPLRGGRPIPKKIRWHA